MDCLCTLWLLAPGQPDRAESDAFAFPPNSAACKLRRCHAGETQYPCLAQTCPILRANPCPKVTNRFCRLPLSTLFYLTRGFSPWRPAAVIGYERQEVQFVTLDFHGMTETFQTPTQRAGLFQPNDLSSRGDLLFEGREAVKYGRDPHLKSPSWSPMRCGVTALSNSLSLLPA